MREAVLVWLAIIVLAALLVRGVIGIVTDSCPWRDGEDEQ